MTMDTANLLPQTFRLECRSGNYFTSTSGACNGYAQANLIVLPKKLASDFEDLCFRNPVPCPLLSKIIDPKAVQNKIIVASDDFDIRTDIPKYTVFKRGQLVDTKSGILEEWSDDHIGFLIGCSFSFENELSLNSLKPKHQILNQNVPMFVTNKLLDAAGVFVDCPYVVSMRPYKKDQIESVRNITRRYRKTHGEPIDWGYDAVKRLGIKDLATPEFGEAIQLSDDEVPVFWGCGVTPQAAVMKVGGEYDDLIMGHCPGHMLILDIKDEEIKEL